MLQVASINCGGRFNSLHQKRAAASTISLIAPFWGVALVQEADACLVSRPTDNSFVRDEDTLPFQTFRWWPGEGSYAMAVVVHKKARHFLQDCHSNGRACVVVFANKPTEPGTLLRGTDAIVLAGVHAKAGGDIAPMLSDLADILKLTPSGARRLIGRLELRRHAPPLFRRADTMPTMMKIIGLP
jgi:hypothetical protein